MATPPKPEDSFPDRKWEDALAFVAPKDGDLAKVTNRTDVTKDPWFKPDHVAVSDVSGDAGNPKGYDYAWSQGWQNGGTRYTYQIGFSLTPEVGANGSDTALSKFIHEPWAIIGPPLNTLIGNSSISVGSFDDGAMMLRNMLSHMESVETDIKSWVKDIDVPDSEMQGTAAGAFKRVLVAVQQQVAYLHQEVVNYGDIPTLIDSARVKLHEAMAALVNAADAYRNSDIAWPAHHVHDLFFNALAASTMEFDANGWAHLNVPGLGSPGMPEFWTTLEQQAKDAWVKGVVDSLDTVAKTQMGYVQTAYQGAIDVIPPAALTMPPYRDPNAPKPPGDKPPGSDTNSGDKPPGSDTNTGDKPPGSDTNTGDKPPGSDTNSGDKPPGSDTNSGDKPPGSGVTGPPNTNSNLKIPPPQSKTTGPPQTNTGNGSNTLLDKNNKSIKDANGNEAQIPPGSHINKDGTITGPDGKLLMGADHKPLKAPPNAHIGPSTTGNSGSNSKSGEQQLKDQQALADKQIKQQKANQQQQLKDQQEIQEKQLKQRKAQEAQEVEQEKAYQKALSTIRGDARTETSGNGYGNKTGGGGRNKLNLEELPPRGNSRSIGDPKTSVSERVRTRTSANEPNLAAEESAVRQSSAMNRTSSNGQPMMPPMGGGGGGGGAGGRDRERRTWLAEDEETWGTSQEAAPGVIG
ncbi:hypothetical protein OG210_08855 [Streptomyces sp. NBC_00466]|uniref:hypothetical protein n=1 Tax=Streptomyces sp. NBC_00466 TaxID=2903655 RepID=UPI0030E18767